MNGCLTLSPLSECGFGTCVNSTCVCDPGVIQSLENIFMPIQSGEVVICDYSPGATLPFLAVLLVLTIFTLFVQAAVVENRRQAQRLLPLLIGGYPFLIAALSIRIARIEEPLWGVDFAFTFLLSTSALLTTMAFLVFINKYLNYLNQTIQFTGIYKKFSRISYNVDRVIAVLLVFATVLLNTTFAVESPEAKRWFTLAGIALYTVSYAVLTISISLLLTKYIHDLRKLVYGAKRSSDKGKTFRKRCKKQLPKAKLVRICTVLASSTAFIAMFCACIFPGVLKQLPLAIYCALAAYQIDNLAIVHSTSRKLKVFSSRVTNTVSKRTSKSSPQTPAASKQDQSKTTVSTLDDTI